MRPIAFVTNRPPFTGGFGPPPPVGVPERLSFGAATVFASADRARTGQLASPAATLGAVLCAPEGADRPLVDFLARTLAVAAQAGRTSILMLHGGRIGFVDALIAAADACAGLEAATGLALAPLAFSWPAVPSPVEDGTDRARAVASGEAWRHVIRALVAARALGGASRCLYLAEGDGVAVTDAGCRALAASGFDGPADLFDRVVLVGAPPDLPLDAPSGLGQLARLSPAISAVPDRDGVAALFAPPAAKPSRSRRKPG